MFRNLSRRTWGVAALAGVAIAIAPLSAVHAVDPPPVSFAPAAQYATGATGSGGWSETSLVTGDFNNDGKADVIGTDYFNIATGAPIVQLGLGNGAFQTPGSRMPSGAVGTGALAVGDFNADGNQDLALSKTSSVEIWRGNGNGTFTKGATYSIYTGGQEDFVVADFNLDGKSDIAVLTRYGVQMMVGAGNGTFTLPSATIVLPAGVFSSGIDEANFNGDGKPDLVLTTASGQVYQLLGTGTGGFTKGTVAVAGFVLGTALAADFNEDGYDDAVGLPEANAGIKNFVVILSDGHGGWNGTGTYYDGGYGPVSGEVADLNDDGHLDVISSDTIGGQVVILTGRGDGTFAQAGKFPLSFSVQTPVIGDFDADGRTDIAGIGIQTGYTGAATLSVLLNRS